MPRRQFNEPLRLRDVCLENIACHFDSYWCAGKTKILYPGCLQKCLESFEYLSDDIIQNLLEVLAGKNLLRRHHFQFLLGSNIRRLNLSGLGSIVEHVSVLETVGVRCRNLTHLNLSTLAIEGDVFCSMIPNLGKLISLTFGNTSMTDNILKAVAENCPYLLELYINMYCSNGCPDYGIQEFAHISEKLGLPKLKSFVLTNKIEISVDTVAALLKSQKCLENFQCPGQIRDAFDILYGKEFKQTNEVLSGWISPLLNLHIQRGCVPSISTLSENLCVELTLRCCPYITDLHLTNVSDTCFSHVSNLRHLKDFHVSAEHDLPINFGKCILPILMKLGNNLRNLALDSVSYISFNRIGSLCLNLDSLFIILIDDEYEQYDEKLAGCFKHLTYLLVEEKKYQITLSEGLLLTMLSNATHMREFYLDGVNLTDDIVSKAVGIHGFRYLEVAIFVSCHRISAKTGMALLHTDNPLRQLDFYSCENISSNAKDELNQEISRMRLNVRMNWDE